MSTKNDIDSNPKRKKAYLATSMVLLTICLAFVISAVYHSAYEDGFSQGYEDGRREGFASLVFDVWVYTGKVGVDFGFNQTIINNSTGVRIWGCNGWSSEIIISSRSSGSGLFRIPLGEVLSFSFEFWLNVSNNEWHSEEWNGFETISVSGTFVVGVGQHHVLVSPANSSSFVVGLESREVGK